MGYSPRGHKESELGKSRGQLLIAPERMKGLGQSRNDVQLRMCLVVKVKSDAVSRVATRVSWSPLSSLKGVQPPLPFGERTRDCPPGHAGKEGPQLARTGASQGFPRAAAAVWVSSRGTMRISGTLHRNMRPLPARVSREVPRSILKFEMLLCTLDATPKFPNIPVSLQGNTEVPGAFIFEKSGIFMIAITYAPKLCEIPVVGTTKSTPTKDFAHAFLVDIVLCAYSLRSGALSQG